ncbi:hypothetical protein J6590_055737 [Homalodisca vitripennis]|nr:hypothetical protein J6590_055737 [Homalodisca vitripennis]
MRREHNGPDKEGGRCMMQMIHRGGGLTEGRIRYGLLDLPSASTVQRTLRKLKSYEALMYRMSIRGKPLPTVMGRFG